MIGKQTNKQISAANIETGELGIFFMIRSLGTTARGEISDPQSSMKWKQEFFIFEEELLDVWIGSKIINIELKVPLTWTCLVSDSQKIHLAPI